METWVKEDSETCRPCLVAPTAEMYLGLLEEQKEDALKNDLLQAYKTGDIVIICQEFDKIKTKANAELKIKLKEIDCEAQSFNEK